jgi:hypothetical protein
LAAVAADRPVRGKDRGELMKKLGDWFAPITVGEFDTGHKLLYLPHHKDQALLGKLMYHCSGTHYVWAEEERLWYFFALVDGKGVPKGTLHTKEEKWVRKVHPADSSRKPLPVVVRSSSGGYATKEDVLKAFEAAGREYEPVYQPVSGFNSRAYDTGAGYDGGKTFENRYPLYIAQRPDGVSSEEYNEFVRCYKAMADSWNKKHGSVRIAGRSFYFDGKKQLVLSFSGGAQVDMKTEGRQMIFEWLNAHQRKDKALEIAVV